MKALWYVTATVVIVLACYAARSLRCPNGSAWMDSSLNCLRRWLGYRCSRATAYPRDGILQKARGTGFLPCGWTHLKPYLIHQRADGRQYR